MPADTAAAPPPNFTIRQGTLDDVETIVAQRRAMFSDAGLDDAQKLDVMCAAFRPWVQEKMRNGTYLAWLAIDDEGAIAAGLGLWLMDWPPLMSAGGKWRGNILNVYTEAPFRRQGLARQLMLTAMAWCEKEGVEGVILHASKEGRPLYESLGFEATNEMRLKKTGS